MFEKFTEDARHVVVRATEIARRERHSHVRPLHILAALMEDEAATDLPRRVLRSFGYDGIDIAVQLGRVPQADEELTGQIAFQGVTNDTLKAAYRAAVNMGQEHVRPEHLLLGVLTLGDQEVAAFVKRADPWPEIGTFWNAVTRAQIAAVEKDELERPKPPMPPRCPNAFTLFGAIFVCQGRPDHDGKHGESGPGWTMEWDDGELEQIDAHYAVILGTE